MEEEEVVPAASFVDDCGADVLDLLELIMALEKEFSSPSRKIEIPDEDAVEPPCSSTTSKYGKMNKKEVKNVLEKEKGREATLAKGYT